MPQETSSREATFDIAKSEWDYSGRFWLEEDYDTDFDHWNIDGDGVIDEGERRHGPGS